MPLRLTRTSDPSEEPVSLAEAKSHLRVDVSDDDTLIEGLIKAARIYVENATRRALVTQTWQLDLDDWPSAGKMPTATDEIALPRPPLGSVTSVVYVDSDGDSNTFSADDYDVDTVTEPGRIVLGYGKTWPTATLRPMSPIAVTYVAGYGDAADVPQHVKQMMLMLLAHWYENREATITGAGVVASPVPFAVESLLWLERVF